MKKLTRFILIWAVCFCSFVCCGMQANAKVTYSLKGNTLTLKGKGIMPQKLNFGKMAKYKKVKKVVVKKGVKNLTEAAFAGCKKLKQVSLSEGLVRIERRAFEKTGIKSITIPKSVKYVGDYAFYDCSSLKKVTCPAYIKVYDADGDVGPILNSGSLENLTFSTPIKNLANLTYEHFRTKSYTLLKQDKNYYSYKGAIYTKKSDELVYVPCYIENFEVAPSCKRINVDAFVRYRGEDYYEKCSDLKELRIPSSISEIVGKVDEEEGITNVNVIVEKKDLSDTSIASLISLVGEKKGKELFGNEFSEVDGFQLIRGRYLYKISSDHQGKQKLVIPAGVTNLGGVLRASAYWAEIELPESLVEIGEEEFYGCNQLVKINIPDSVQKIGDKAFFETQVGACIPEKWAAEKNRIYEEYIPPVYEDNSDKWNLKISDKTAGTGFYYEKDKTNEWISFTMKKDGIFVLETNMPVKLYDKDKKEIMHFPLVKEGDVLYVKTPEKLTKQFAIYDAFITPCNSEKLHDVAYYMGTGETQYTTFKTTDQEKGKYIEVVDYNIEGDGKIQIAIEKNVAGQWVTVRDFEDMKGATNWDKWTRLEGSKHKSFAMALNAGMYRVAVQARKGAIYSLATNTGFEITCAGKVTASTQRANAMKLYQADAFFEPKESAYYRYSYCTYEDGTTYWYQMNKRKNKNGFFSFADKTSGKTKVTIYRGKKKVDSHVFVASKKQENKKNQTWKYKVAKKGNYFVKFERYKKTNTGYVACKFDYK